MPIQATSSASNPKSSRKLSSDWISILDRLPGLVAAYDIRSARWIYISPNVKAVLGYAPTTFLRKSNASVNTLLHPDDASYVQDMQQEVIAQATKNGHSAKELLQYECRLQHKSGAWCSFQTTASIFTTSNQGEAETLLYTSCDITDRKNQEQFIESLKRSFHYRFRALIEKSNVGVVLRDANLHYTYASPAVERVFGYSVDDYLKLRLEDYMHPDDVVKFLPKIEEMRRTPNMTITAEIRVRRKDGALRWVEVIATNLLHDPIIQAVVSNFRDITDRYETTQELKSSQERLDLALQASGLGIWDWEIATNQLVWSPRLEELYGLAPGAFLGTFEHFQQLVHPDDREMLKEVVDRAMHTGEVYSVEHRVVHPNGSVHWLMGLGKAYLDEHGEAVRMLGTSMNIDERTELQRRKDDFMAIASHELKTPVTSLKVFAQILTKRLESIGLTEMSNNMRTMDTQLSKLSNLVNDLLDATKIDAGKIELRKEVIKIDELVQETCELMQFTTTQHVISVTGSTKATIYADRDRISQVLTNLLSNAIKYSPQADKIDVMISRPQGQVKIDVVDYGIGISTADQKQIFDRFYRVEGGPLETYPGLGLGLYISAEIVRRHQGIITVLSRNQQGSTFTITLPQQVNRPTKHA